MISSKDFSKVIDNRVRVYDKLDTWSVERTLPAIVLDWQSSQRVNDAWIDTFVIMYITDLIGSFECARDSVSYIVRELGGNINSATPIDVTKLNIVADGALITADFAAVADECCFNVIRCKK